MTAIILHNGRAVRDTDLINLKLNVWGVLSSFSIMVNSDDGSTEEKKFTYYTANDFSGDTGIEKRVLGGYFEVDKYQEYMTLVYDRFGIDKGRALIELQNEHSYDLLFEDAQIGDTINTKIVHLDLDNIEFYKRKEYSFEHIEGVNYILPSANPYIHRLDESLLGTANIVTVSKSSYATGFFNNHITAIDAVPVELKENFALMVIFTALRIDSIINNTFSILNVGCDAGSDINQVISSIKNKWENEPLFDSITYEQIFHYRSNLVSLYAWVHKNTRVILQEECDDLVGVLLRSLPIKAMKTLPLSTKTKALDNLITKRFDSIHIMHSEELKGLSLRLQDDILENDEVAAENIASILDAYGLPYDNQRFILRIIASIADEQIDGFLDYLLIRDKVSITRYESLYFAMDDSELDNYMIIGWFVPQRTYRKHFAYGLYELWQKSKYIYYDLNNTSDDNLKQDAYYLNEGLEDHYEILVDQSTGDTYEINKENILEFNFTTIEGPIMNPRGVAVLNVDYINGIEYEVEKEIYIDKVRIYKKFGLRFSYNFLGADFLETGGERAKLGDFHLYMPIMLKGYNENLELTVPEETIIPAFLFHYAEDYDNIKDLAAKINFLGEITLEAALFYFTGGLGALRHIRHLKQTTKVGRALFSLTQPPIGEVVVLLKGIYGLSELVTLSASVLYSTNSYVAATTNDLDEQSFKKDLAKFFLYVMLGGAATSIVTSVAMGSLATKIVDSDSGYPIDAALKEVLISIKGKAAVHFLEFKNLLSSRYANIHTKFLNFSSDGIRNTFYGDFGSRINDDAFMRLLNDDNASAALRWDDLRQRQVPERAALEVITNDEISIGLVRFYDNATLKPIINELNSAQRIRFINDFKSISEPDFVRLVDNTDMIIYWKTIDIEEGMLTFWNVFSKEAKVNFLDDFHGSLPSIKDKFIAEPDLMYFWSRVNDSDGVNTGLHLNVAITQRRNIDFLELYKTTRYSVNNGNLLVDHIFIGHTIRNATGIKKISGVHKLEAITESSHISLQSSGIVDANQVPIYDLPMPNTTGSGLNVAIEQGSIPTVAPNGVYEANIWVWGHTRKSDQGIVRAWKPKNNRGVTTMFPNHWTKDKTIQEITYARLNLTPSSWQYPQFGSPTSNRWRGASSNEEVNIEMFLGSQHSVSPALIPDKSINYGSAYPILEGN